MVGQRGIQVSGLRIRITALNSRAIYQYSVGGGLSLKKRLRQFPLLIVDVDVDELFFLFAKQNRVRICSKI